VLPCECNSLDRQLPLVDSVSAATMQVDVVATDASEDDGKDRKDNTATEKENVDGKPDSAHKRQLSVREKAAAFLENAAKDSVC